MPIPPAGAPAPTLSSPAAQFLEHARITVPVVCGAMYPCSNPELIAAVSAAGGIGIVQPLSMEYVHRHEFRAGLKLIRSITDKPIGLNIITERSSSVYQERMRRYLDVAVEEGIRFFVTSLGNPKWIVDRVREVGGIVYHDVTARKWALKAIEGGVHGLIAVNSNAGGHAGALSPAEVLNEISDLGLPVLCAGGIGDERAFVKALELGYAGVQMGTRFIATNECRAHVDYKQAILDADPSDIVLTDKVTGVPLAVINTPYIEKVGTRAGVFARWMLRNRRTKHWMRMLYSAQAMWKLKRASLEGTAYSEYYQAGKSVGGIDRIEPAGDIVRRFAAATAGLNLTAGGAR
jgi:nitronate monooxygenase